MKILVTGSHGFIGKHYCAYAKTTDTIVELDKSNNQDINQNGILDQHKDFDAVLHLAATNGTKLFYENPTDITVNDTLATINIVKHFKNTNTKIVFTSSSEVINGAIDLKIVDIPVKESAPIVFDNIGNPRWCYSLPKALGENLIINSKSPYVIIRYFNVYGPGQRLHFIDEFIKRVKNGEYYIKGNDYRSFCYIDDAVVMTHSLIKNHSNLTVNVGNDEMVLISDVAKIIMSLMDVDPNKLEIEQGLAGSASKRCPDISLAKKLTNFSNFTPLHEGLKKTIESIV